MIVLDASAFTELLTVETGLSERIRGSMMLDAHWCTTEHFRNEVANALRRLRLTNRLQRAKFEAGWAQLSSLDVDVWPTIPLLPRIGELYENATAYDAAYVALAEELGCALLTADAKLSEIPGARCQFLGATREQAAPTQPERSGP